MDKNPLLILETFRQSAGLGNHYGSEMEKGRFRKAISQNGVPQCVRKVFEQLIPTFIELQATSSKEPVKK
jgi:hypothetical protein